MVKSIALGIGQVVRFSQFINKLWQHKTPKEISVIQSRSSDRKFLVKERASSLFCIKFSGVHSFTGKIVNQKL